MSLAFQFRHSAIKLISLYRAFYYPHVTHIENNNNGEISASQTNDKLSSLFFCRILGVGCKSDTKSCVFAVRTKTQKREYLLRNENQSN